MLSKHKPHIDWFRDAAPYINAHRGKTVVIALPSASIADPSIERFIHDVALLHFLGIKIILVHGSRHQIDAEMLKNNIESKFQHHIRVTSNENLELVTKAIMLNTSHLTALFSTGLPNTSMSGARITVSTGNYINAMPVGVLDGVDMQHTGKVRDIQCDAIQQLLDQQHLIILPNLGFSKTGEIFNLSMTEVATQIAIKMQADKLIFIHQSETFNSISNFSSSSDVRSWITQENLEYEDSDLLNHSARAIDHKVNRVHIINQSIDGGLLLELFTREGSGLLISNEEHKDLRQATIDDIGGISELIQPLIEAGQLVSRTNEQLEIEIPHFYVIEVEGLIAACVALFDMQNDSAELACLAVHENYQNHGFASRLLQLCEQKAKKLSCDKLFSLSTQAEHWFLSKGFLNAAVNDLPGDKQAKIDQKRHSKILIKSIN